METAKQKKIIQGKKLSQLLINMRQEGKVKKRRTQSQRAGLIFPVSRIHNKFKQMCPNMRIFKKPNIELTGIIEYLIAEVLDIAGKFLH
jgi:hypothetical protein